MESECVRESVCVCVCLCVRARECVRLAMAKAELLHSLPGWLAVATETGTLTECAGKQPIGAQSVW